MTQNDQPFDTYRAFRDLPSPAPIRDPGVKKIFLYDIWQAEGSTAFLSLCTSFGVLARAGFRDDAYWFCGISLALYGALGLLATLLRDRDAMGFVNQFGAFVALVNFFAALSSGNYVSIAFFIGLLVLTAGFWLHREVEKSDV